MDDEQKMLEVQLKSLRNQLKQFPNNYELHENIIGCLKSLGYMDELREARKVMQLIYPLSPSLWLEWIKDEITEVKSVDNKIEVEKFFKQAINDYEDVNVWLEYCQYKIGCVDLRSEDSVTEVISILEQSLSHQGLNIALGSILWEVYREFQYIVFTQVNKANTDQMEKQISAIDELYRRQLSIPLLNMEQTFTEYGEFLKGIENKLDKSILPHVKKSYENALARLKVLMQFEEALEDTLEKSEEDSLAAWTNYLDWAVQSIKNIKSKSKSKSKSSNLTNDECQYDLSNLTLSPNEICCLFERAITVHCLYPEIWLKFDDYLESNISSDTQRLIALLARSVRNCPWSVDLWSRYALLTEVSLNERISNSMGNGVTNNVQSKESDSFKELHDIYENALIVGFESPKDVLRMWTSYCDHHVRRIYMLDKNTPVWDDRLLILRQTFNLAIDYCFDCFAKVPAIDWHIIRYYATIEAKYIGDLERARLVWSRLMQFPGHGSKAMFWLDYIQFEQYWGDSKHLIRVCNMAINSINFDECEHLFDAVLQAITSCGIALNHYKDIIMKIRSRRARLIELKNTSNSDSMIQLTPPTSVDNKNNPKQTSTLKRKISEKEVDGKISQFKIPKVDEKKATHPFVHGSFVAHDHTKDKFSVFVSNLDFTIEDKQLIHTFSVCGDVVSVRVVLDYASRSKGFAYVEFKEQESVDKALKLDRQTVSTENESDKELLQFHRPMFVSVCDPNRLKNSFPYSVGKREPEKLFVRNLEKTVTKDDLEKLFQQYGSVVDIRLATFRNGLSKGYAYIEFENANDASRALVATNELEFCGKELSVAISEPPTRLNSSKSSYLTPQFMKNDSKVNLNVRSHSRTQLQFLPRALNLASGESVKRDDQLPMANYDEEKPKTNEYFRNLLK